MAHELNQVDPMANRFVERRRFIRTAVGVGAVAFVPAASVFAQPPGWAKELVLSCSS